MNTIRRINKIKLYSLNAFNDSNELFPLDLLDEMILDFLIMKYHRIFYYQ